MAKSNLVMELKFPDALIRPVTSELCRTQEITQRHLLSEWLLRFCLSFIIPINFSWPLTVLSFLDGSSTLLPSVLPGESTQKKDADEQEDAAGHCYLILHCKYECLHGCSCFCELWEVCGSDWTGSLTLRRRISAFWRFFTSWEVMVFLFIYTRELGLRPPCFPTHSFADAHSRTSL